MPMALMRYDPFRELDRLSERLWGSLTRPVLLPMDAYRHGEDFVVKLDLPGIDPSSVEVSVEQNVLTVKAERNWIPAEGDEVLVAERPQGSFSRQLFLGENLDTEHVSASYDAGVLTITIPVHEAAKPRRIEITTGSSAREPAAIGA
jgi:HSP20 family protein